MARSRGKQLLVCVDNRGYRASLERRKIYVALRDAAAEKHGVVRIVDESGEDYLYPKAFFRTIVLPSRSKGPSWLQRNVHRVLFRIAKRPDASPHRMIYAMVARIPARNHQCSGNDFPASPNKSSCETRTGSDHCHGRALLRSVEVHDLEADIGGAVKNLPLVFS